MKYTLLLIAIALFLSLTTRALAATPTPTESTSQNLTSQINQLKDKIASRVSELNLVEKRGVIGTIQEAKNNQVTLTSYSGDVQYIDVDEITKFSSAGSSASFGISDLKKGMLIRALGIYNKESQRILARYIDTETIPTRFSGEITTIDTKQYRFTVMTGANKEQAIDIETTSKISSYNPGAGITAYGFSKLSVGDRVEIIGYPDKKDATLLVADRVIDYLDAPKDPRIAIVTPTTVPTQATASKGAKSLSPIK